MVRIIVRYQKKKKNTTIIEYDQCFLINFTLFFLLRIEQINFFVVLKVEIINENMKNQWFPIPTEL
jgi:hypothetical protein